WCARPSVRGTPRRINELGEAARVVPEEPRAAPTRAPAGTCAARMTRARVVIVGGGFGGLACARALDGTAVDVQLIDGDNYHLFTPLLYQVATALLNPSDIAYPLRRVFRRSRNVRFRHAVVEVVDVGRRVVRLLDGTEVPY